MLGAAIAAAAGRLVLAHGARASRARLSPERREHLAAARAVLEGDRLARAAGLALFAVSPVPSAQLFVAAGLLAVPLVPLTIAFFAGRLVSYSVYAGGAALVERSLSTTLTEAFTSPLGIALQLIMLAGLVALVRVNWMELLARRGRHAAGPSGSAPGRAP